MQATIDLALVDRDPDGVVIPGVVWGRPEWVPSAAFWAALAATADEAEEGFEEVGASLAEVVGFCILGGYGVTYEVNQAAHDHLLDQGVYEWAAGDTDFDAVARVEELLRLPLTVHGRRVHYRFPRQRARRLVEALRALQAEPPPTRDCREFRDSLMAIKGIGPKTASWIARNHLGAKSVAILDVHVIRAGRIIGLFGEHERLPRDYHRMELRFLEFAHAIGACPAILDAVMWRAMRNLRLGDHGR
ncbi:hypothetical protein VQH23_12115 [Pararoseomonas sp. SCSIO 73927]|uniref:8-oxoguanine DNA glycosylase n=1 Tax=Pararoseomonas sp. SCSIO 73927 TaxID=3114537 RepID=UPI0030CBAAFF